MCSILRGIFEQFMNSEHDQLGLPLYGLLMCFNLALLLKFYYLAFSPQQTVDWFETFVDVGFLLSGSPSNIVLLASPVQYPNYHFET